MRRTCWPRHVRRGRPPGQRRLRASGDDHGTVSLTGPVSEIEAMSASPFDTTREFGAVSTPQRPNGERPRPVAVGQGRLGPWWRRYAGVLALLDAIAMGLASVVAQQVRFGSVGVEDASTPGSRSLRPQSS